MEQNEMKERNKNLFISLFKNSNTNAKILIGFFTFPFSLRIFSPEEFLFNSKIFGHSVTCFFYFGTYRFGLFGKINFIEQIHDLFAVSSFFFAFAVAAAANTILKYINFKYTQMHTQHIIYALNWRAISLVGGDVVSYFSFLEQKTQKTVFITLKSYSSPYFI